MEEEKGDFPCSICDKRLKSPRDLGTHILKDHCEDSANGTKKEPKRMPPQTAPPPSAMPPPPPPRPVTNLSSLGFVATPIPAAVKAIVAPVTSAQTNKKKGDGIKSNATTNGNSGVPTYISTFPRSPTEEEIR